MDTEDDLLTEFRKNRSEAAFRGIVEGNLGFVLSVAQRVLHNPDLARDVAQGVFVRLAKDPQRVPAGLPLAAWLHRTTRSAAIDLVRAEETRRRHERTAADLTAMKEPATDWSQLSPEIDRALDELPEPDRIAVVLRFFKNHSHAEIGATLGVGADAARMRVTRALERLRDILGKRGVTIATATLAATLPAHAGVAVPVGLSASITSTALASATAAPASLAALLSTVLMNAKTLAIPAACLALIAVSVWQRVEIHEVTRHLDAARASANAITSIHGDARDPRAKTTADNPAGLIDQARRLAALEPLAAREAALLDWAQQFTSSAELNTLAASLRDTEDLPPELRTRLAKALTEHWAMIDPAGAMDAFATSALLAEQSPFGTLKLDYHNDDHGFDSIARSNPGAFTQWLDSHPDLLLDLLLGKGDSADASSLLASAGRDPVKEKSEEWHMAKRASHAALVRNAPLEVLSLIERHQENAGDAASRIQINGELLSKALLVKVHPPQDVWNHLSEGIEAALGSGSGFTDKLAEQIAKADTRPASEILSELQTGNPDWSTPYRLANLGPALTDAKNVIAEGDTAAEDKWWSDFDTYANLINSSANAEDPRYDATRRQMAGLGASEDKEAGIEWARSITDDRIRFLAAGDVALRAKGLEGYHLEDRDGTFGYEFEGGGGVGGTSIRGTQVEIPEDASVEEIVRLTEQAMEGADFRDRTALMSRSRPNHRMSLHFALRNRRENP